MVNDNNNKTASNFWRLQIVASSARAPYTPRLVTNLRHTFICSLQYTRKILHIEKTCVFPNITLFYINLVNDPSSPNRL